MKPIADVESSIDSGVGSHDRSGLASAMTYVVGSLADFQADIPPMTLETSSKP